MRRTRARRGPSAPARATWPSRSDGSPASSRASWCASSPRPDCLRLRRAQQENRLDRELASIGKARLLIIDEFGYLPIDEEGSRLLFQIISDSYETRSIIYTTNIEFSGWDACSATTAMAAALIDRTVHHGRLIRFEGRPYRTVNTPS